MNEAKERAEADTKAAGEAAAQAARQRKVWHPRGYNHESRAVILNRHLLSSIVILYIKRA